MKGLINSDILKYANRILLFLILFFTGLYFAASFLIPVAYAIILAMMLLPLRKKLERSGLHKRWSTLLCVLILFAIITILIMIIGNQLALIIEDLPVIEAKAKEKLEIFRNYLYQDWGLTRRQQSTLFHSFSLESQKERLESMMTSFAAYLGNILLILVYVYVFLYFKDHFERFILKLVPDRSTPRAEKIMHDATNVAERYLVGKLVLMIFLAIVYTVSFLLLDIKYAVFYAIFAAILSIIPYIGNIIGAALPFTMTLIEKNVSTAVAIIIIFSIVQFIETYIFEPLIVGKNVNLNPPFSILIIVLGGAIWGISGMILAIPYLGILQIIFSYVEPLKPFGFLIGDTETPRKDLIDKLLNKLNSK